MLICVSLNDGAMCSHKHTTYSELALHPDICTHNKSLIWSLAFAMLGRLNSINGEALDCFNCEHALKQT